MRCYLNSNQRTLGIKVRLFQPEQRNKDDLKAQLKYAVFTVLACGNQSNQSKHLGQYIPTVYVVFHYMGDEK